MTDAIETVQRARGKTSCDCHTRQQDLSYDVDKFHAEHHWFADPLADTPEGDHEWWEILRWAEKWCDERGIDIELDHFIGMWHVALLRNGTVGFAAMVSLKAAFLEALAAAIKGEQGT